MYKMYEDNAVVGVYNSHTEAEAAITESHRSRLDLKKLSVVGKDYAAEKEVVGYYNRCSGMPVWGKVGPFWHGDWNLLSGSGFFYLPGIGRVMVFGMLVSWIIGKVHKGDAIVAGVDGLRAALDNFGVPRNNVMEYETALKVAKFLVIAHGTVDDVAKARSVLETTGAAQVAAHLNLPAGYSHRLLGTGAQALARGWLTCTLPTSPPAEADPHSPVLSTQVPVISDAPMSTASTDFSS